MDLKEKDKEYIAGSYARFPVEIDRACGSLVYDTAGKEYIDLGSGIAVNTLGFADEQWTAAVTAQLAKYQHTSNLYYTQPCADLAEQLCERTGMKKVFFTNSGAEANECAIKAARRYAFKKYGDESHSGIITLKNSFHGRTVTTLSATGQDSFHTEFGPFTDGFYYAEPNNIESFKAAVRLRCCSAVMFELILGEGGVLELNEDYVSEVVRIARANGMLVIVDEVQTGNGRTGSLYAFMQYGFTPDVLTTAKGLAGGLPMGATLLSERVEDIFAPGMHGSTFGGNPAISAGALNILSRIDGALLEGVKQRSEYIRSELEGAAGVTEVSGRGLMLGIACTRPVKDVIAGCMENGVLVLSAKGKVRLLPALNIPFEQLETAMTILKKELAK